ncbi:MAG TPA: LEPR-XLL domain-containing protein [Tepidisphaeraceae bacterium]|nr:LEPR-XLL domain-containing protein [Tepidisphaeraceae bacterium]
MVTLLPRMCPAANSFGEGGFIEALEDRMLLSAAPVTIPTRAIGPTFSGTVHLRYHAAVGIRAHASAAPVTLQFSSLSNGVLDGTISADSQGEVSFSGPAKRRSFDGVFADGTIAGALAPRATSVHGTLRETVNGELITGRFAANDQTVMAKSSKRSAAQTTALNFQAGAGTTVNAVSASNGISSAAATTTSFNSAAPTQPVSLPALETSFVTSDDLNTTTTAGGVSSAAESLGSVISSTPSMVGTETATPGATQTLSGGTGNSIETFSSSSGIVSITNSGNNYSSSSGIVSITAPPSYSQSSGIAPMSGLGI